jgi:two-component system chemotaxis response regulator CheB
VTTRPGGPGPVRVVVADDSPTARRLLVELCDRDPGITVVGQASDGEEAVELTLRLNPTLVLLDVNMPVMDGVEATKQIMREQPTPIIMVTAGTAPSDVEAGLSALRFGALTVLPKPVAPGVHGFDEMAARMTSLVKALADVKVIRRREGAARRSPRSPRATPSIVAVAASTGGPPAVTTFLQHLPADLPVPVVVVQHIVEGFLPGLVTWLRSEVPFHVTQAEHRQPLEPGTVYLAPDGRHLEVDGLVNARLTDADPVVGFRPSASVLFSSLARNLASSAVAVILTGMGQDGLEGARRLRAAGGRILVQDEPTSVVYGMPKVVADAGLAHVQGPIENLAAEVAAMWRK